MKNKTKPGEKIINVTRSSMPPFEEYCEEIRDLWEVRWLTNNGAKHQRFQGELETYLDVPHVTLFTNGHLALEYAIAAMELPQGGEVVTTPFTFASTTHAIARNGLVPVFCDVNDADFTMDASKIEALITDRTVAVVPVHAYGNLCDVETIRTIADRHGLKVLYDAAHAFGVTYRGTSAAAFGDVSMLSFHATKVFHTIEGGAVCFHDGALADKLDRLKNFGIGPGGDCAAAGGNAKMTEFQAAMGLCNLRHVDEEVEKRKLAAARYWERLSDIKGIRLCSPQKDVQSNYAYFPVVFDGRRYDRNDVFERLRAQNINARKYFYPLTNAFTCYRALPTARAEKTPVANYLSEHILSLPLYADLTYGDVDRICNLILQ